MAISSGRSGISLTIALGGGSGSRAGFGAGISPVLDLAAGLLSAERAAGVGLSDGLGGSANGGND